MSCNTTQKEAKDICIKYWASKVNASMGLNPLAQFIEQMRGLGYPAMQAALIYNIIEITKEEAEEQLQDRVAKALNPDNIEL